MCKGFPEFVCYKVVKGRVPMYGIWRKVEAIQPVDMKLMKLFKEITRYLKSSNQKIKSNLRSPHL